MRDQILASFLRRNRATGMALAAASDRLALFPEPGELPQRFVAEYRCPGLIREASGEIAVANVHRIGIVFQDDFLKQKPNCFRLLTWLEPTNVWHPNVRAPFVCCGNMPMGTDLLTILLAAFELITYQKFATADPLNPAAAEFARANMSRFPLDSRPLRRRAIAIEEIVGGKP